MSSPRVHPYSCIDGLPADRHSGYCAEMISAVDALERLREGNRRFVSDEVEHDTIVNRSHQADMASGQNPFAIVLATDQLFVEVDVFLSELNKV